MFIAKDSKMEYVIRGSQIGSRTVVQSNLTCPICGDDVEYDPSAERRLDCFYHADGSPDCFASGGASDEHRLGVEVAVGKISNRLSEVTGECVEIDTERRIGTSSKFVITDVRVSQPLQIAAEIFYKTDFLALDRRIPTLSRYDYRTYLIFDTEGVHDINRIDRYMQRISPLSVGRFNPGRMEISLGDLFSSEQIDFRAGTKVPNYMIFTGPNTNLDYE